MAGQTLPTSTSQVNQTLREQRETCLYCKKGVGGLTCRPHGPGTGLGFDGQSRGSGDRTEGNPGGTCPLGPHVFLLANRHHLACFKKEGNFTYEREQKKKKKGVKVGRGALSPDPASFKMYCRANR